MARAEKPEGANFVALGAPDAGVECYRTFHDNTEWGWQAKYFTSTLGSPQWRQIDHSVETALDKHPELVRYIVCVPRDLQDARKPNEAWEMDQWISHVGKWEDWAKQRGMNVEFVLWGSSELLDRLSQNEHIGRRLFWFGHRGFDQGWFHFHLEEALRAAGPRYTPEVNIELDIAQEMERFSRSSFLFNEVKSLAIDIRRTYTTLMSVARTSEKTLEGTDIDELSKTTGDFLDSLAQVELSPIVPLPIASIAEAADKVDQVNDQVTNQVRKLRHEQAAEGHGSQTSRSRYRDPIEDLLYYLQRLQWGIRDAVETCSHAGALANGRLLILRGEAGTGKTHLLCDFAKKRIEARLPTVIVMGQRFLSNDDPWTQLIGQLDLSGTSAEEFVGTLETAAQASDCRALVMIDALNEGNGKEIWRAHLSSFLSRLEESPWIGVVLSVRSSYEEAVIPDNVREKAVVATHYGFDDHEYDAARTFFSYYGLEFPSVPILQPEFRNPLYLKTICKGLRDKGERRIPRGFHGITSVFSLYLETISDRLAADLDYNPRDNLVRGALGRICELLVETETRWLPRPLAEQAVNDLLPGRSFSNSLYGGLVTEGVLVEDRGWSTSESSEEVVFISYDRFADHMIADYLLRTHLNMAEPEAAFADGGGLAFLNDGKTYVRQGLIEALCIQVPEHTGHELVRLASPAQDFLAIGDAFLESLIWRNLDAFSDDTLDVLNELVDEGEIESDPMDALLTVSTIPSHPLNADFLDQRLRGDSMPDRDAWWSIYLHRAWGCQGPVDRLVDWASGLRVTDDVEDTVIDLSAATLGWMFTTPNRFLRDRATKALVSLLTGRPEATIRFVDRFADVDDPYVLERLYAVAYGTAMRSYDVNAVGKLAYLVYEQVFASGTPPAHILLRDYARGIIERALYLGADIPVNPQLFRPPYDSVWPAIPCEDCVEMLFPSGAEGARNEGDLEWARDRIRWSVLGDDFARYVIGNEYTSHWMSLLLEEEAWQTPEERKQALLLELNESELAAWDDFQMSEGEFQPLIPPIVMEFIDAEGNSDDEEAIVIGPMDQETYDHGRLELDRLLDHLKSHLTPDHRTLLESILRDEDSQESREGPRLDKQFIQRYILWRVFDLGWTIDRFGQFDQFDIGYSGREAAKPERMGKKYQWIAYHEILAFISDNFQYCERWSPHPDHHYQGPWQEMVRDIDPSFTLSSIPGGTSWGPHTSAWWGEGEYAAWEPEIGHLDWLSRNEDIPEIKQFLQIVHPKDGTSWLNVHGYLDWRQPHSADVDPFDVVRREIWISCIGYFIKDTDLEAFSEWAFSADTFHLTNSGSMDLFGVFIGEYGWSPAYKYFDSSDDRQPGAFHASGWSRFIRPASRSYHAGVSSFDCSADDSMNLLLPHHDFVERLGLKWNGAGLEYMDQDGNLGAFDPTSHDKGPTAFLLREDLVERYLADEGLALCWVVFGEKWVIGERSSREFHGALKIRGVYYLTAQGLDGQLRFQPDLPEKDSTSGSMEDAQEPLPQI